ncbi:hypothetical protein SAMN05216266_103253 [Amycolatopsis marina]|uniref:Uncharacterized protein n=1 Tax=Amycolatopsis marina TaxID=490629 RepID=A0A1I0XJ90_9PSEU|nr:hypothetical protein [Amycolatopsis marina]SFB00974.1 hypothetical protein SAMN05216266_103253 [Amycolatopsis marina]
MADEPTDDRQDSGHTPMPENPRARPEQTVDSLEDRVFGETQDQQRDEDPNRPAYEQDIEPEETTADQGHQVDEPPE